MKISNAEAMKLIKELEVRKNAILRNESSRRTVSYKEGEKKVETGYDYGKTREEISAINSKIRALKFGLAKSNCAVMVEGFDMTVGEALVYLAQLNSEYSVLLMLSDTPAISRRITANGVLEYTECLYDPDAAAVESERLYSEICRLQVAIDRANLLNFIEI